MALAPTLAQRVQQLRDFRNLTVRDLARLARFKPQRVEDIESGMETWLSSTDRQMLAKALNIEPYLLQEVEVRRDTGDSPEFIDECKRISESILLGAKTLECPRCRSTLRCTIQEALDIEGQPIRFPRAFCMKCPFVLS